MGPQVASAHNAGDALAPLLDDRPDAVIVDAVLPKQSGLMLARSVIDLGIPVLLITGEPKHQRLLGDANCAFLPKSFSIVRLLNEIRLLLDEATQRMAQLAVNLDRLARNMHELHQVIEESRALLEQCRRERLERAHKPS